MYIFNNFGYNNYYTFIYDTLYIINYAAFNKIITNNLLDQYSIILTMNNMTILLTKDGGRKPAPCVYNDVCIGKHDKHGCTPRTPNLHLKIFSKSVDIK